MRASSTSSCARDFEGLELSGGYGAADGYDETTGSVVWGIGDEDSNVTFMLDYFKNSNLFNTERGSMGSANQTPRGGQDFRSSRGYPDDSFVNGVTTVAIPLVLRAASLVDLPL